MANGPFEVSSHEQSVLQGFGKFILHDPATLTQSPVVNPVYPAAATHLASWGFIVIGTAEENDWNGFSSEMCIHFLELLNEGSVIGDAKDSIFRGRIDFENVFKAANGYVTAWFL